MYSVLRPVWRLKSHNHGIGRLCARPRLWPSTKSTTIAIKSSARLDSLLHTAAATRSPGNHVLHTTATLREANKERTQPTATARDADSDESQRAAATRDADNSDASQASQLPDLLPHGRPEVAAPGDASSEAPRESGGAANNGARGPNYERNAAFRHLFRENGPEIDELVKEKLSNAFVPSPRQYPNPLATNQSRRKAEQAARTFVAIESKWESFGHKTPEWKVMLGGLRWMTGTTMARDENDSAMSAMRVVLPAEWASDISTERVSYLDSITGVRSRVVKSGDHRDRSTIVLRGRTSALASAAEELVQTCGGAEVEVFSLGEVDVFDYNSRRLWPDNQPSPDVAEGQHDNVWIHRERQHYWMDELYEDIPKPETWTQESLDNYITRLACGRLNPGSRKLAKAYSGPKDTDGIRVKMMKDAIEECPKHLLTPAVLKMAIEFMAQRGGHRASAYQLFKKAEEWGVPMDAGLFNIMLEAYVKNSDVGFFHAIVIRMRMRWVAPNAKTWLLFCQLVQKTAARRQIIQDMSKHGLFREPAARRGIAAIMASHDAYAAFQAGKSMAQFQKEQAKRYGADWFTSNCLVPIAAEVIKLRASPSERCADLEVLFNTPPADGAGYNRKMINDIIRECVPDGDWTTALLALRQLPEKGYNVADWETYSVLIDLAIQTQSQHALGVAIFYAVINRKLGRDARHKVDKILHGKSKHDFWWKAQPFIFDASTGEALKWRDQLRDAVGAVEWAIMDKYRGYKPVAPLSVSLLLAWYLDAPARQSLALPEPDQKQEMGVEPVKGEQVAIDAGDGDGDKPPVRIDYVNQEKLSLDLVDPKGVLPPTTAVLDSTFEAKKMWWSFRKPALAAKTKASRHKGTTSKKTVKTPHHKKAQTEQDPTS